MRNTFIALAAVAALTATLAQVAPSGGAEPGGAEDHARIDPSKTLELIRRIKDAGGPVFAS